MSNDTDLIKQRLDIVEVVQEYVPLKKMGSNWKANCPFHNEKSPSFMVSQEKQIWHCFGCDRGGDMFSFVQEIEGVEFPDALRSLATRAGVELQYSDPQTHNRRTKLLTIVERAQRYYQTTLQEHPEAEIARQYLVSRGITENTQEQFGLGYSLDTWDALSTHLHALDFSDADVFAAGLTIKKDAGSGYYDRFRGRVMIPLYDVGGQVVGFTARTLKADETGGKYINSPQSDIYDKSAVIYGLHKAKQAIKQLDASIIVEGNLDVISAHQAGFPNVVAVSGTALTDNQVRLLKRYSENMLFAFDMDAAGIRAAQRGIDIALQHSMNIKVIQLPSQFKDPDDCIQNDPQLFKQSIRSAIHIIDFFFKSITSDLDLRRVEHKKKAVKNLLPVLLKITDSIEQAHYIQKLADLVQVEPSLIQQALAKARSATRLVPTRQPVNQPTTAQTPVPSYTRPPADRYAALSREVIAILLGLPDQFKYCLDYLDPAYLTDEAAAELYKRMTDYYNNNAVFDESKYLEQYRDDTAVIDMLHLLRADSIPNADRQILQEQMISVIRELHKGYIIKRLRQLESQIKQAEQEVDAAHTEQLLQEFQMLTNQLTELS